jgi:hypothetical protein
MSETLVVGKAKLDTERNPEEITTVQGMVSGVRIETRTEAGTRSWQPQNRTVRFPELDHSVSATPGQKQPSRTTAPETAPAPHRCPPGFTPNQRRRIQRMRAQKMREEVDEKERDEYFNVI